MARADQPTGKEIAEHAHRSKYNPEKSVTARRAKDKLHVRFTPALFESPKKKEEMEAGFLFGEVDLVLGESQTDLPPGKYNIFVAKVGEVWRAYAELNGTIMLEAKQVDVKESQERDTSQEKPRIEFGSLTLTQPYTYSISSGYSSYSLGSSTSYYSLYFKYP